MVVGWWAEYEHYDYCLPSYYEIPWKNIIGVDPVIGEWVKNEEECVRLLTSGASVWRQELAFHTRVAFVTKNRGFALQQSKLSLPITHSQTTHKNRGYDHQQRLLLPPPPPSLHGSGGRFRFLVGYTKTRLVSPLLNNFLHFYREKSAASERHATSACFETNISPDNCTRSRRSTGLGCRVKIMTYDTSPRHLLAIFSYRSKSRTSARYKLTSEN